MYGVFTYICHKNQRKNLGKYTIFPWIPMGSGMSTSQKKRPIYRSHWQLGIPANSFDGIHLHRIPIIFVIRIFGKGEVVVQHHTYPEWLPVKPWKEHAILFQTFHFLEGLPFWVFLCWDTPSNSHQASYAKQNSQLSYVSRGIVQQWRFLQQNKRACWSNKFAGREMWCKCKVCVSP